jgi:hypothetical protein
MSEINTHVRYCAIHTLFCLLGVGVPERSKVRLENWRGLTLAGLGWWQIDSEAEVEAAQAGPYHLPMLGPAQLMSDIYANY